MARYIPTDRTAQTISREYLRTALRNQFERGRVYVILSDMREDGTYAVTLAAQQAEFDVMTMLDEPTLRGTAWIEDNDAATAEWDFGGESIADFMSANAN